MGPEEDGKKKKEEEEEVPKVGYWALFRYATTLDKIYLFFGTFGAIVHGVSMPALFIIFGDIAALFVGSAKYGGCSYDYTTCVAQGVVPATTTQDEFNAIIATQVGATSIDLEAKIT